VSQTTYIVEMLKHINISTQLLEMLDWDEENMLRLFSLLNNAFQHSTVANPQNVITAALQQNHYEENVIKLINKYLNESNINKKKEKYYEN